MSRITILINCKDKKGIIANTTNFIHDNNGNIVYIDQYVDRENGVFFMRLESEFKNDSFSHNSFKEKFNTTIAKPFEMDWQLFAAEQKTRVAIFVSKYDHCLYDILGRYNSGELHAEIPLIISNHPDLKPIAESFGIDFHHIPVTKDNKTEAEKKQLELLKKENIELIVLARYMQIVTSDVIKHYTNKIINIHHSFLPAFVGAKPYHSAYNRGVKIIGTTSHYVTEELDAGPIIEQDVVRVSHSHSVKDFIAKGKDLERIVLARALKLHLDRKTMVYNNKTVVFT